MAGSLGILLLAAATITAKPAPAFAGVADRPRPGIARNAWDEDVEAKRALDARGAFFVGTDVVLWYPKDSLSSDQAARIAARLDRGIRAAKQRIGKPDWQVEGDRRVHFYCPAGRFISHAPGGNCAFIPLWRMRDDEAPWLHEALHLLLATSKGDWLAVEDSLAMQRMPLWLSEGLADALAMQVSQEEGLVYYSPLLDARPDRLDSLTADALRRSPSDSVLAKIGARGKLPQLFGPDRMRYALPFYAGSASFARFISRRHGFEPLLRAIADFDHENETLAREVGEPLDRVKSEWLAAIGYTPAVTGGVALPPQRSMDEMHGDCASFSWNMDREWRLWEDRPVAARASTAPRHPPVIKLDQRTSVTLTKRGSVRFAVAPEKAMGSPESYSGLLRFVPTKTGVYRVSAGGPLWIDAVVEGHRVASERFEMQTRCRTIFKSVAYALRAGVPVTLQLSGSETSSIELLVTPWE